MKHFLMTLLIIIITCTVAFVWPDIVNYISLLGGTCCTLLVITLPGFYKLFPFVTLFRNVLL